MTNDEHGPACRTECTTTRVNRDINMKSRQNGLSLDEILHPCDKFLHIG